MEKRGREARPPKYFGLEASLQKTTRQNIDIAMKTNLTQTHAAKLNRCDRKVSVNSVRNTLSQKANGLLTATVSQSS